MLNPAIIKAALLGLKSNKINPAIFHPKVQGYLGKESSDEVMFLNGISLSFQYFEAGRELAVIEKLSSQVETCPEDHLPQVDARFIRALRLLSQDDLLRLNYYSFLRLLAEKALAQKSIFPADQLIKVLLALDDVGAYEKRRMGFNPFYKANAPRDLYLNFDDVRALIVQSFGASGSWINNRINASSDIELDDLDAKGRMEVFRKYWFDDRAKVLPFLASFFEHESPANQKNILKIIGQGLTSKDEEIYDFFEEFFEVHRGKRMETLRKYFRTVKMLSGTESADIQLVESVFVKIWAPRSFIKKTLKLLPKAQLEPVLAPLEALELGAFVDESGLQEIDLKLFFLFQLIPVEKACELLKVKSEKYLKAISEIKSYQKNKSFRSLRALIRNVIGSQNKDLAKAILALSSRTNSAYLELLLLFDDAEIYELLEKDFSILDDSELDVFEILVKELNCRKPWSKKLTRLMLNRILTHQHFYSYANRRNHALWLGGPFYSENVREIVSQLMNSKEHEDAWKKDEIQMTIGQIIVTKSAFNNALNQ